MALFPVRPVTVSAMLDASPEVVLAYVADTRNDAEWCPNVDSVEQVAGDGVSVGARFRFHQHLDQPGGRRTEFDVDVEVTAPDNTSITWLVSDRFQQRIITMSVEPAGDRCRISQTTAASFRRKPASLRWIYPVLARRTLKEQFRELGNRFD